MNRGTWLGVGGLVVVAVIVIFAMQGRNGVENTSLTNDEQAIENETSGTQRNSFAELMQSCENVTCTYEFADASGSQNGTVYVAGQNMRGDFTIAAAGTGSYETHMISDGEWSYMWCGPLGASQGTKIKVTADSSAEATNEQTFDYDDEYDFDCEEWNRDDSKFDLPSGVSFTDLSAQVEASQNAGNSVQNMQCAACDQLPDAESQAQCRQALSC